MSKRIIWVFIGLLVAVTGILVIIFTEKVMMTASSTALTEQGWRVNFSKPVKADAIGTDDLYIMNKKGERVGANTTLTADGQSLLVKGLTPGSYTLHVKNNAVQGKGIKRLKVSEVKFSVYETLEAFTSADELEAYFERARETENIERSYFKDILEETSVGDEASSDSAESATHSTTNNQVEGVDEADSVKTDGQFIYSVIGNGKVVITDIRNPDKLNKASEIKADETFYPFQLFLHNDTLIVLGERYDLDEEHSVADTQKVDRAPMNGATAVRLYDISNRESPLLIREIATEGYFNGARKKEEMIYFVTNVYQSLWGGRQGNNQELRPHTYDTASDKEFKAMEYADIAILPGAMEPSYSVITAIDITSPAENKVVTKAYLGGGEQMYMSMDHLYLTTTLFDRGAWNGIQGNITTELFKFGLDHMDVTFQSSAQLKGSLLNQFSMDEYKGYFRVVTTEGDMWDEKNPSENHLFILNERLEITGTVEGLAKGERIYSARFMGDKAYMVTFRETDPLFVIDVEDPTAPKVLGELKIPGFSNYLHPLDENHLIGFGYETVSKPSKEGGEPFIETLGMKISLFDVSDFENPKEKDTEIIGGRGTYSSLQNDHKALFTHKEKNLYGFPVVIYNDGGKPEHLEFTSSGALVYEITPDKGIVLKGDLLEAKSTGQQYEEWEKEIQRLLYSEDRLYTIAMEEIKSYSLNSFSKVSEIMSD